MPYVYSTLTCDQEYTVYGPAPEGAPPTPKYQILIKGGANLADRHTILTPRGAVTDITEEQEKILMQCDAFKEHMKRGFVKIEKKRAESIEAVASDLQSRDASAPVTPQDVELEGKAKLHSGKK